MLTIEQRGEAYLNALAEALADRIRENLKEKLRKTAEAIIDDCIQQATKDLEFSIRRHQRDDIMKETIEVVLTDKRADAKEEV